MPTRTNTFQRQPIETAPEDQEMWLEVISQDEIHTLPFACTRKGDVFRTAKGATLQVTPLPWKLHHACKVSLNPQYVQANAERKEFKMLRRMKSARDGSP